MIKIGDVVVTKCGLHKGDKHKVIWVFEDGSMNVVPLVSPKFNRYHLGAASAMPDDITLCEVENG